MKQDEITKGVSVDRQEKQSLNPGHSLHAQRLGEEKGPAKETDKEQKLGKKPWK